MQDCTCSWQHVKDVQSEEPEVLLYAMLTCLMPLTAFSITAQFTSKSRHLVILRP